MVYYGSTAHSILRVANLEMRRIAVAILFSIPLAVQIALAQELALVAPGQVVVDYPQQSTMHQAFGFKKPLIAGLSELQKFGQRSAVLGPSGVISSISTEPTPMPLTNELSKCDELLATGMVLRCSPNYYYSTTATPNDPLYSSQIDDSLGLIKAAQGWDIRTDASSVVVAVLDTGVDYNHPDLAANIWTNPGEIPGNGIDDDANGYVDDVHGINAITGSGNPMDDNFHGTHVAGTIGAVGNNGIGVTGIAWNARIMALKWLDSGGGGWLTDVMEALDYALAMKNRGVNLRVTNNSWGGGGYTSLLQSRINALKEAGVVFVAAAGNSGSNNDMDPTYPANYDNAVSVLSTKVRDEPSSFSCFGATTVDIGAPGDYIRSTIPGGGYGYLGGTSMATPHVVGALALLFAKEPSLTVNQAVERLLATGDPVPILEGITVSGRRLNLANLLSNTRPPSPTYTECQYTVEQIPYDPPTGFSSVARTIPRPNSDWSPERESVSLPFQFPFYDGTYNSVWISLNGMVYFVDPVGRARDDWHWTELGWPRSIAPLHNPNFYDANLNTQFQPDGPEAKGVRVLSSPERFDVEWIVTYAESPEKIEIVLSLFPDGRIESYTSVPSARLAYRMRQNTLVGIRGGGASDANILSFRGFPIVMGRDQGFAYTRGACSAAQATPTPAATPTPTPTPTPTATPVRTPTPTPPPIIANLSLADRRGTTTLKAGAQFFVGVYSSRAGELPLTFELNGTLCAGSVTLSLIAGDNNYTGRFPTLRPQFTKAVLRIPNSRVSTRINGGKKGRAQTHQAACSAILKALQEMRKSS